jgi:hypothetical protein
MQAKPKSPLKMRDYCQQAHANAFWIQKRLSNMGGFRVCAQYGVELHALAKKHALMRQRRKSA